MRVPRTNATASTRMEQSMTGMIDVVFLLLIFFVLTASFQPPEQLLPTNVQLPGSVQTPLTVEPPEPGEPVIVRVTAPGGEPRWEVANRELASVEELGGVLVALADIDPAQRVILDVAREVALGDGIDVYDLARAAGFEKIQFAAEDVP